MQRRREENIVSEICNQMKGLLLCMPATGTATKLPKLRKVPKVTVYIANNEMDGRCGLGSREAR
jgi:hypothetical protein